MHERIRGSVIKGLILAGGNGTRLAPLTNLTNKHLLPVYKFPMIIYPLDTLISMGCDDILIVTGGEHIGDFASYLGDGSRYGVRFTYRVQPEAGGIAQALGCAEGFIKDTELFPVILGDNYFEVSPGTFDRPTIYIKEVEDAHRFGVYDFNNNTIIEKPSSKVGYAVTGLYIYNYKVFNQIRRLEKSERGELEITDINNWYLENEGINILKIDSYWRDMGTHDTLLEVANHVQQNT